MKKYLSSIQSILIVVLVVILLFQSQCSRKKPVVEPEVIVTIETKWDTVEVVQTEYVPKWRTKVVIEHDTVPSDVDTMMILNDYYSKYSYVDTLTLDTLGFLVLNDTITMNSISSRSFMSNIKIVIFSVIIHLKNPSALFMFQTKYAVCLRRKVFISSVPSVINMFPQEMLTILPLWFNLC